MFDDSWRVHSDRVYTRLVEQENDVGTKPAGLWFWASPCSRQSLRHNGQFVCIGIIKNLLKGRPRLRYSISSPRLSLLNQGDYQFEHIYLLAEPDQLNFFSP